LTVLDPGAGVGEGVFIVADEVASETLGVGEGSGLGVGLTGRSWAVIWRT